MKAMDKLNRSYGRNMVSVAAQGGNPDVMNREHLSQQFTTNCEEIIKVNS